MSGYDIERELVSQRYLSNPRDSILAWRSVYDETPDYWDRLSDHLVDVVGDKNLVNRLIHIILEQALVLKHRAEFIQHPQQLLITGSSLATETIGTGDEIRIVEDAYREISDITELSRQFDELDKTQVLEET